MCLCLHVFVSVLAHLSCDCCCKYCIILLTLSRNVDVMCTVCTFPEKNGNLNRLAQIAQPCPEQGELVNACIVQLPCCSDVMFIQQELFRSPRDNHALNVILQSPLLNDPSIIML